MHRQAMTNERGTNRCMHTVYEQRPIISDSEQRDTFTLLDYVAAFSYQVSLAYK